MPTKAKRASRFNPNRVYLEPFERLHAANDCSVCAPIVAAIKHDKVGRRMIPEQVLEDASALSHLEDDVLGRPVDFGDPARIVREVPFARWYGGDA